LKAVVLHEVDGDLAVEDVPDPEGDNVVDVRAAGVNFLDVLVRHGMYPQMPQLPHVLGSEVAGELDGKRVMALPRGSGGGYAERVEVDPRWTFELPESASFAEGASFLMTFLTAFIPLERLVRLTPESTVLVHAGSGGVGVAAIQVAKFAGATVIATASTDEKRAFAREHGADEVRGYDELDDVRVDVVFDPVGGDVFASSLKLLEPLGSIVAVGFAGGQWQPLDPALVVGRNVSVVGFYLGRLMQLRPDYVQESARELIALWRRGEVRPVVGATFPLEQAAAAHALIERREHVAKVVLEP
jgi:NADPH2:quinone reductase